MADGTFNIAKGRVVDYYNRVESNENANSALVIVALKAAGLEADDTLNNYDDLAALLAATNDECDFTGYARIVLTDTQLAALPAPDDTNNRRDLDLPDQSWDPAGGATNNSIGKVLVCFDPDTTAGTDSSIVPLTHQDFVATTDGNALDLIFNAAGWHRSS